MGDQRHGLVVGGGRRHSSHWASQQRGQLTHHRQASGSVWQRGGTQGRPRNRSPLAPPPPRRCAAIGGWPRARHPLPSRPGGTGPFTEPTSVITAPFGQKRDQLGGRIQRRSRWQSQHHPGHSGQHGLGSVPTWLPGPLAGPLRRSPGDAPQARHLQAKPPEIQARSSHRSGPVRTSPPVGRATGCHHRLRPLSPAFLRLWRNVGKPKAHHQLKQNSFGLSGSGWPHHLTLLAAWWGAALRRKRITT